MQEVFSRNQATATIKVPEGDKGTVILEWLNEQLEPATYSIAVAAKSPKAPTVSYEVQIRAENCITSRGPRTREAKYDASKNEPIDLRPKWDVPFHAVIEKVDKPLFWKAVFEIQFGPDVHLLRLMPQKPTQNG